MEVGRGPAVPVRDFSVVIHTGRPGEASRLLSLANGQQVLGVLLRPPASATCSLQS